jgi:Protein of unknown function (DUF3105)
VRSPKLSRRALVALNIAFTAGGIALLVVAALALTRDREASPEWRQVPASTPGPLRTTVRTHSPVGRFERAVCRDRPHSAPNPASWFHPEESFYPPGSGAPSQADLDHLVNNDDAVVVRYRRDASPRAREALREWAAAGIGVVVAPSPVPDAPPLEAYTATRRLTCDGIDLDRLTSFTDRHFTQPLGYRPHEERSE